ncbi:hypothetical protein [Vannielia sp.]|uniref:hypothetical protein n=1 Tax=Vannielia sp. TaxID=2813045 RepID=UPI00261156A4|nr:hypothetical protein [Vannielia sp.]MDF1872376.1 hypothetical protein [Vannielia sp.]
MDRSPETARAIHQSLLDRSGEAYRTGSFELFAPCFALPTEVHTFEATRKITNEAELEALFDDTLNVLTKAGAQLIRIATEALFADENTIKATHSSRLVIGDRLLAGPFPIFFLVKRSQGAWRLAASQYAVDRPTSFAEALSGVPTQKGKQNAPD